MNAIGLSPSVQIRIAESFAGSVQIDLETPVVSLVMRALSQQCQEAAKHMASNGVISFVVDGASFKDRCGRADNVLDRREPLSLSYSRR